MKSNIDFIDKIFLIDNSINLKYKSLLISKLIALFSEQTFKLNSWYIWRLFGYALGSGEKVSGK